MTDQEGESSDRKDRYGCHLGTGRTNGHDSPPQRCVQRPAASKEEKEEVVEEEEDLTRSPSKRREETRQCFPIS